MLPPERRLERSRAENIKANGFPRRREPRDSGAFRFLKNQINRSLRKTNRFFRKAWYLESIMGRRPLPPSARHRPSFAVALDSAAIAALSEENIYNLLLLAVARGVGLADLDTQWCARLRRSGPQHRRIRAHHFF